MILTGHIEGEKLMWIDDRKSGRDGKKINITNSFKGQEVLIIGHGGKGHGT